MISALGKTLHVLKIFAIAVLVVAFVKYFNYIKTSDRKEQSSMTLEPVVTAPMVDRMLQEEDYSLKEETLIEALLNDLEAVDPDAILNDDNTELLSNMIERSLESAVEKAVDEIKSPKDEIVESVRQIYRYEHKYVYSLNELNGLSEQSKIITRNLKLLQAGKKSSSRAIVNTLVFESRSLRELKKLISSNFCSADKVTNIKELILFIFFCSEDPLKDFDMLLQYNSLYVHNKQKTFELLKKARKKDKEADAFLTKPHWNLWSSPYSDQKGAFVRIMQVIGVGGKVADVAVEVRSSNIIRATNMLRMYVEN